MAPTSVSIAWRRIPVTDAEVEPLTSGATRTRVDLLITNAIEILTCVPDGTDLVGRLHGQAIAIAGERIIGVAPLTEISSTFDLSAARIYDASGQIVAPGFVDSHTHLVFGGSRAQEYGLRMTHTAEEIEALGIPTGIPATVEMTRSAATRELQKSGKKRLERMMRHGTTTVESKSGYGLSLDEEIRILEVNRWLQEHQPLDVVSTFLGAHDFPAETSREAYVALLVNEMVPHVAERGLAEFCDVYCDDGYYTAYESRQILEAGLSAGLLPKIHTDAYSDIGGAALAAELPVVSADHLNYTSRKRLHRLAQAGVTAVVMPTLDFAVRHPRPFDGRAMIDEGLTVALATDFCPACWVESMQLVMALACRLYQFSPEEALLAATTGGAAALNLHDRGSIIPGKLADLQFWQVPTLADVIYRLGNNAVVAVIKRGLVFQFSD